MKPLDRYVATNTSDITRSY